MLPTHHGEKIPTSNPSSNHIYSESVTFAQAMSCFYLTFSSIGTIYRAYINDDIPMVVFIIFVYLGYFVLDHCLTLYKRLPPHEESSKKEFLKVAIWVLISALLFSFAYQFSTFMSPVAAVPMFGIAFVSSAFLFYAYFIYDDNYSPKVCRSVENIENFQFSCPGGELGDKNVKNHAMSNLENV